MYTGHHGNNHYNRVFKKPVQTFHFFILSWLLSLSMFNCGCELYATEQNFGFTSIFPASSLQDIENTMPGQDTLETFMDHPLRVSAGELIYLRELYPDLPASLPCDSETLQRFAPWSSTQQEAFFAEYPYLIPFRSILVFETEAIPYKANASVVYRELSETARYASIQADGSLEKKIRINGIAKIDQSGLRWYRRRVDLTPIQRLDIHIGTLADESIDRGFFYGYFPSSTPTHTNIMKNWLYGDSPTWNGISIDLRFPENLQETILFHKRDNGTILGVCCQMRIADALRIGAGATGFLQTDTTASADTMAALYTDWRYITQTLDCQIMLGLLCKESFPTPIVLHLLHGRQHNHTFEFVFYPASTHTRYSRLYRTWVNRIAAHDTANSTFYAMEVYCQDSLPFFLTQFIHLRGVLASSHYSYLGTAAYTAKAIPGLRILIGYSGKNSNKIKQFWTEINLERSPFPGCSVIVEQQVYKFTEGGSSLSLIGFTKELLEGVFLKPQLLYEIKFPAKDNLVTLVVDQRLHLMTKTSAYWRIQIPLYSRQKRELQLHAKVSCSF